MEIDLNELERLAEAATPGPWVRQDFYSSGSRFGVDGPDGEVICASFGAARSADYEHIAAANPAVVLELVRRLRAAETALDAAQARVKEDRDALIVCHRNPATGIVDDELGAVGLAEYNHVLKVIADAMQPSKDHES